MTPISTSTRPVPVRRADVDTFYRRRDDLRHYIDKRGFLIIFDRDGDLWLQVRSPVGQIIWNELADPVSGAELHSRLRSRFPDVDPSQIGRDIEAFLDRLEEMKLLSGGPMDPDLFSDPPPEPFTGPDSPWAKEVQDASEDP